MNESQTAVGKIDPVAIGMFFVFVAITLAITYWASKRSRTAAEFYAAGRSISGLTNGLATAGDYNSAASFLGIAGLVSLKGYDGLIYSIGFLVGWPIVMFLIAEPLRNLGKFTFADVVAFRFRQTPVRVASSIGAMLTIVFYLTAQIVGAGSLVNLVFGLPYEAAVVGMGVVVVAYVLFGGMLATTWVQLIKACLMLAGAILLAWLTLRAYDFSPVALFDAAASKMGDHVLAPGNQGASPWNAISLGLALMFGTAGLPHILMRFYTVPNAKEARKSVFYATGFIGFFFILTFIIGFGAMVLVGPSAISQFDKGGNMAALLLAEVTGGPLFLGFIAAVAFATILAVVAGLTLSGASVISHDLYVHVFRGGKSSSEDEVRIAKLATILLGLVAVAMGLIFKGQNVAFMVGLAFAIAASGNFPALLLSIVWDRFTTAGAVASMLTGTALAAVLIVLSPTVWVDIFKNGEAIFSLTNPALVSMPASFLVGIVVSILSPEPSARQALEENKLRMYLGVNAE